MFDFLPEQASELAYKVDEVNNLITIISLFFTVTIVGVMVFFAIRYRRDSENPAETPRILGNNFLELIWTAVPSVICVFVAYYGIETYRQMNIAGPNPLEISVSAKKWKWDFEYNNGKRTSAEFIIPVGRPVRLIMRSNDVLHSFFIPAMRVKKDVLPGAYTSIPFTPIKIGTYNAFCTEYCGRNHATMLATLRVVSDAEFDRWLSDRSEELALSRMSPVEMGRSLHVKHGCQTCHSLDGSVLIGPSFLKLFGRETEFADGTKMVVDENYIRESVLEPAKRVVRGFPAQMPSFEGQLSEAELDALIAFVKAVEALQAPTPSAEQKEQEQKALAAMTPAQRGKQLYSDQLCGQCHSLDGSHGNGPSFKGLYGSTEKLSDGSEVTVDDAYITRSIFEPNDQIAAGFQPAMPPIYKGKLSDAQVKDLIEFMKSVK